ncbi:MAG: IPT/TIG domain-containing protein [Spirochaetales bacterium]|nr:IPT/TIG domain-containing protein [Spirochaetales bacterium]
MEEKKVYKSRFFSYMKKIIPFSVFILLTGILIITSNFSGRSPQVDSITPKVGAPGSELIIKGKYFGRERKGGKVSISGVCPATGSYKEWTDNTIRLVIPEDINSGLLKVITRNGESSKIVLFANKKEIPVPLLGPLKPGEAYISSIKPNKGPVGTLITINGMNFQSERNDSKVYFAWISGDINQNHKENIYTTSIPAAFSDYDYEFWSEYQVKVRVPDGASSGNIYIATDKGISNAVFFEVQEPAGQKRISNKKIYQVYYWVKVKVLEAQHENSLHLWIPGIMETPYQQEVTRISSEPGEPEENVNGILRFTFNNLLQDESEQVKLRFIFKRYEVSTRINPHNIRDYYNSGAALYKVYTRANSLMPVSDIKMITLAREITGKERNPYLNAQHIYNYVLNTLTPVDSTDISETDLLNIIGLQKPQADAYIYSLLFCTLTRSAGIPARPVAGYLVCSDLLSHEHYWAEFYIENFGWVPVDPYLGDGKKYSNLKIPGNFRSYYFGNLDNNRITFTRGIINLQGISNEGRTVRKRRCASFQSIFEESSGELTSYSTYWSSVGIIGFY